MGKASLRRTARRARFWLLERLALPLAIGPLRLLVRSWRLVPPDPEVERAAAAAPRLVMVGLHGMLAPLLAFAPMAERHGRRLVVMLSPSHDGRLLAALLGRLGIGHVFATDGSRAVAGAREFVERVAAGEVGFVAVDGPRGPRGAVKPGAVRLAAAAGAHLLAAAPEVRRSLRFGSWDRPVLPLPFTAVRLSFRLLEPPHVDGVAAACGTLERFLAGD